MIVKCNQWEGIRLVEFQTHVDDAEMIQPLICAKLEDGFSEFCFQVNDLAMLDVSGSGNYFLVVFFDYEHDESYSIQHAQTLADDSVSFIAGGQLVEVSRSACCDLEEVMIVVRAFFEMGGMCDGFDWVMD